MRYLTFLLFLVIQEANAQLDTLRAVPGSSISLRTPKGFETATNFTGFQNTATGASILVMEVPGPYNEVSSGFTEEKLAPRGIRLISKTGIEFQQRPALLLNVSQDANGHTYLKYILIFGNDQSTTMINGMFPKDLPELEADMKASVLSATVSQAQTGNPLDAAAFMIDPESHHFRLANGMGGMLTYSLDGKLPSKHPDKAAFIAGSSLGKAFVSNKRLYALQRFKKMPGADKMEIGSIDSVQIDGLTGYALSAFNKEKDALMYQVILYTDDDQYYLLMGTTEKNALKYQSIFEEVAQSFRRKRK